MAPKHLIVRSYRDLDVWQRAMDLVADCYHRSRAFPRSEQFGLVAQLRRAAVSIPANIAEGHGREHLGDYLRHLSIANGSLMEMETHILISMRLQLLEHEAGGVLLERSGEVGRMLAGLIRALKRRYHP